MMDGLELQMLIKLGIVLLLIFPALWGLRRLVGAPTASGWRYRMGYIRAIHVLETQPLAEGQRLYLVRIQGRHLLLGGCKESMSLLAELEAFEEPEVAQTPRPAMWGPAARFLAALADHLPASLGGRVRAGRPEAL